MPAETRRILLVEDEKSIRDAVAAYLEREGYWVTPAADGQAALDAFAKYRFELVVLDLMLPKVSGEDVCRAIRDASDVPIIMLTAKGEEEDRIAGLELGADDYLVKPFEYPELAARLKALLRRSLKTASDVLTLGRLSIDLTAQAQPCGRGRAQGVPCRRGARSHRQRVQVAHDAVALPGSRVLPHGAGGEGPRL